MIIPKNIERRIKQHVQAKDNDFFAVVQPGFEQTALKEMSALGLKVQNADIADGGIGFTSNIKDVWKCNFASRCLTRILMRIDRFKVLYFEKLRERIADIPWELYLVPGRMPGFSVTCRHSRLYHTGRIEEECTKGILCRMESVYTEVMSGGETCPAGQTVFVRFEEDVCTVSIDTTGEPLYRRGFRTYVTKAPMRETLASLILREASVEGCNVLLDPMCGSGVIALEGAMIFKRIPAGMRRHFAFEDWPGHRDKAFGYMKKTIEKQSLNAPPAFAVYASDIDEKAVEITRHNMENSGLDGDIHISCADFFSLKREDFPEGRLLIATNPPYGGRIDAGDIMDFYRQFGIKLRKDFPGSAYAIVVPGPKAEKELGIVPQKKIPFVNGGIKVALVIGRI